MSDGLAQPAFGGVELGGTKIVCAIGTPAAIVAETRLGTGGPEATLAAVTSWFREQAPGGLQALGVASFGPVELRPGHPRFGFITTTPKPGWKDVDVVGELGSRLDVPIGFDTDVGAAALAEGRLGAARCAETFVYVTVGTGIGGGAVVNGRRAHGLVHPEMGHVNVTRQSGDDFLGVCPYHADCLEGMASGAALEARFGTPPAMLVGAQLRHATELASAYVASGLRNIVYILAPERIVVGGGVASMPGFVPAVAARLRAELAGYPGLPEHVDGFVVSAELGGRAGIVGALLLAAEVASPPSVDPMR